MSNKERIKEYIREVFGERFTSEEELEEFATKLLERAEYWERNANQGTARVWKKEEIEAQGIEVTPVRWQKFD